MFSQPGIDGEEDLIFNEISEGWKKIVKRTSRLTIVSVLQCDGDAISVKTG